MKDRPRQNNPQPKMSFDAFMLKEDKKIMRREILENRKKFYKEKNKEYRNAGNRVTDMVLNLPEYKEAKVIMCFVSFEDEVYTHAIIKQALKAGKKVCVPFVEKGEPDMVASHLENFNELKEGFYGILSPVKEKVKPVDPKEIDLILAPGVAFDSNGYRIGYGGGFYDKFLNKVREDTRVIALGLDLQKVDEVPKADFDMPIDALVTESGITWFNENKKSSENNEEPAQINSDSRS